MSEQEKYPKISIAVACLNEEKYIETCLASLLKQSYKGELEIIVADGGSNDSTIDIINKIAKEFDNVKLISNPSQWQASGRNLAFKNSSADYLAYIDAHSFADENWLQNLYNAFVEIESQDKDIAGVGSIYHDAKHSEFTLSTEIALNHLFSGAGANVFQNAKQIMQVDNAYACLYKRSALEAIGFYDEKLKIGEDIDLNQRLVNSSFTLFVEPKAITYYFRRENLGALYNQQFQYGYWRMKQMKLRKTFYPKPIIAALGITWILLTTVLSAVFSQAAMAFFMLLYLQMLIFFSMEAGIKHKVSIGKLLLIFPAIHFGYAFGVMKGFLSGKP